MTLTFGTAGLRAPVGPGDGQMNVKQVTRVTAGLASWFAERSAELNRHHEAPSSLESGIGRALYGDEGPMQFVVGHDARYGSSIFATTAAEVLAGAGFDVMLLPNRDQIQLADVLSALGHPIRLAIVAGLSDGGQRRCGAIVHGVTKSTLTHHWRVLRDAGVIFQEPSGRENLLSLRFDDLNARFPGLLPSIIATFTEDDAVRAAIDEYLTD